MDTSALSTTTAAAASPSAKSNMHDGGWMERKEGKLKKTWRKHYYVMENSCLVEYFDSIGTSHTSRFYPFQKITELLIVDEANHCIFSMRCDGRLHLFRVESPTVLEDWVCKLRKASLHSTDRARSRSTSDLNNNKAPFGLQEGGEDDGVDDHDTSSEDGSASEEEEEPVQIMESKEWGQRMRRFLSLSREDLHQIPPTHQAPVVTAVPHEVRTVQVVEFDLVEVFEHQRWFPITGWSSKLLKHERATFTSRNGLNRVDFYRNSLSTDNATEASSGEEDAAELPGAQVHVIKNPWEWHSAQWQVQPLIGLAVRASRKNSDAPSSPGAVSASAYTAHTGSMSSRTFSALKRRASLLHSPLSPTTTTPTATTTDANEEGWCMALDFPDIDAAIARGVQLTYPMASGLMRQVRTRRLVRMRRRVISITAHLPERDYFPLFPAILSFQRQVICEGWLGLRTRRMWKSKYCKLIRYCGGMWDGDGMGKGIMIKSTPSSIHLVAFECKEAYQRDCNGKSIPLLGESSARMSPTALFHEEDNNNDDNDQGSLASSLTLNKNRFSADVDQVLPCPFFPSSKLESRSGRFELVVGPKIHFLFGADTSADCAVWVQSLNDCISELTDRDFHRDAAAAAACEEADNAMEEEDECTEMSEKISNTRHATAAPRVKKLPAILMKQLKKTYNSTSSSPSTPLAAATASSLPTSPTSLSSKQKSALDGLVLCEPVVIPSPLPSTFLSNIGQNGKLKEWVDFELQCNLQQFFSLFYSDDATYSTEYFHRESGDVNIKCPAWSKGFVLRAKDEFDFDECEEFSRERMVTLQMYTGSAIAPLTRVEKHQRYYYYATERVFVMRSTSHSLDIPFADAFVVIERWVVEEMPGGNKCRVRIVCDAVFSKPPFGFIAAQIRKNCNLQIPRALYAFRDKSTKLLNVERKCQVEDEEVTAVQQKDAKVSKSEVNWKSVGYAILFMYMTALVYALLRLAIALEQMVLVMQQHA